MNLHKIITSAGMMLALACTAKAQEDMNNECLEPVCDEVYGKLP